MFKQLTAFGKFFENHMINRGRTEARRVLLTLGEAALDDIGIDRTELAGGIKNWPWDGSVTAAAAVEAKPAKTVVKVSEKSVKQAVFELNNYSDRELRDIGISRGMIQDAVMNGRPDIDNRSAA